MKLIGQLETLDLHSSGDIQKEREKNFFLQLNVKSRRKREVETSNMERCGLAIKIESGNTFENKKQVYVS